MNAKPGKRKPPAVTPQSRPTDAAEADQLDDALAALADAAFDDPTRDERHALRRDVLDASRALERKQERKPDLN